jgi:hypothetical protein
MACPLCRTRKPRRRCPALGETICPVCCGTKRLVEIACPRDCPYLAGAEAHPPAAVRRQRQRDFEFAASLVHQVTDGAYALILSLQDLVARYRPTAIPALTDPDVAEACATLAATLETSAKGIIYEHQARSLPAQRLAAELRGAVEGLSRGQPASAVERDAAQALRRMEAGAKSAAAALGGSPHAYLDFLDRLPRELAATAGEAEGAAPARAAGPDSGPGARSSLILP